MKKSATVWQSVVVGAAASLLSLGLAGFLPAAPGDLDPTFGTGGTVTTDFGDPLGDIGFGRAHAIAIQPDGKIVVAGAANADLALVRYNSDGTLDSAFGSGGKVFTDFGSSQESANAVAIQSSDGRIVVAGTTGNAFLLARYNPDGTLDASFGSGGTVTTVFPGGTSQALALALQADRKIVVAGKVVGSDPSDDIALARYNTDGTLDPTFGGDGRVTTEFPIFFDEFGSPMDDEEANAVAIQPVDGKIVIAGSAPGPRGGYFALARYNPTGTLDPTFGGFGTVTVTGFPSTEPPGPFPSPDFDQASAWRSSRTGGSSSRGFVRTHRPPPGPTSPWRASTRTAPSTLPSAPAAG